jgi:plastocyanin
MLRQGRAGRKARLVFGAVFVAALVGTGAALAASATIVGTGGDVFSPTDYTADQGEVSQLQVTGSNHNVTARQDGPDGRALFRSATITGGTTAVNGTQYLSTGSYAFFCTIHPSTMNGTLQVSANGTPVARPRATLKLQRKSLSKAVRKGILVSVNATAAVVEDAVLTAKSGKATIGKATVSLAAGSQAEVVKLSKSGRSFLAGKLAERGRAKVTVSALLPFGSPASTKGTLS